MRATPRRDGLERAAAAEHAELFKLLASLRLMAKNRDRERMRRPPHERVHVRVFLL